VWARSSRVAAGRAPPGRAGRLARLRHLGSARRGAFYGEQLERIRVAALGPGKTSVDVVALSLPGQCVVVAAADHPERFGRVVLISPTGFGRFKGSAGRTSEGVPREYERYCWRTCQQPGAFRAPLAFVSGLLNDPRAEGAYGRLASLTLLVFGDHPRFTDPAASEALVAANDRLRSVTIDGAGDLPQLERPGETAAVVEGFLRDEPG